MQYQWTYLLPALPALLSVIWPAVESLGCFRCTSINHSNPECEDTFNNTERFWEPDCWGTRKNRMGIFPGTQCIKMIAEDEGFTVVVRNCVVDGGGTNSETEIGRLTHCGWMRTIKYLGKRMTGCILACDTDGCNAASLPRMDALVVLLVGVVSLLVTSGIVEV